MSSVLVVDEDADTRDAVGRALMKLGYAVRAARSGHEALIAVATTAPDVIVLDVRMPEMDGMEFLQVIRSYLRWSKIPVVLVTAYPDEIPLERAHQFGVKMIFVKSTSTLDDLMKCVGKLLADPPYGVTR